MNWTDDQFKLMCCLAGCDYVKKIRNVGLVTAHKLVHKHRTFAKTTDALMLSKFEGVDGEYIMQVRGCPHGLLVLVIVLHNNNDNNNALQ